MWWSTGIYVWDKSIIEERGIINKHKFQDSNNLSGGGIHYQGQELTKFQRCAYYFTC